MKIIFRILLLIVAIYLISYFYGRVRNIGGQIEVAHLPAYSDKVTDGSGLFRIATYNIAHGRGSVNGQSNWSGKNSAKVSRLKSIGRYFKDNNTDILILNEVDFSSSWSGNIDQASIIAESGEFPYIVRQVNYDLLTPGFSLKFGNAILSRYPIEKAYKKSLPALSMLEFLFFGNHDAVKAYINLSPEISITVWGLHLEVRNEETRVEAITEILRGVSDNEIVIIAGDLNSEPNGNNLKTAFKKLSVANKLAFYPKLENNKYTFPSEKPKRRLDWVFYSPQWDLVSGAVPLIEYSDHLPVIIGLKLK